MGIVIAIDGPAGAGKSSVARMLACRLGFEFLDTGALYRCVTLAAQEQGIDVEDDSQLEAIAQTLKIELRDDQVKMNGRDVSQAIRRPEVAQAIGRVADNTLVRRVLTTQQRNWTTGKCVVTEGRDQGTEVFPNAECKIFLVASPEERARRRQVELSGKGVHLSWEEILRQQEQRDQEDQSRPVGALRRAKDAIEFYTDAMTLEQVVAQLHKIVEERLSSLGVDFNQPRQHRTAEDATSDRSAESTR